ncbi:glycosyltransferase family 4 protein [Cellvibrio sp. UBA7671]|uniref:glycosyltransferase family 4 protein n=1 Tax=Cellvibrio sp. UBA7671 TaxID=1946312 RepID=UPI002F3601FD
MQTTQSTTIALMHFGGKILRGTEVCAIHTIDALQEAGYRVLLIANNPDVIASRTKQLPDKVLQSAFPEIMFDESFSFPLWQWLKKIVELKTFLTAEQPALLLSSGGLPCQMGKPISKWLNIPILVHLHHPAPKRYFYFWMLPWADLIIAPSRHTQAVIQKKCNATAQVVYNGIDVEKTFFPAQRTPELRNSLGISDNAVVIASIAALVPHKRIDLFLRALAIASTKSSLPLHAVIIGTGPDAQRLEQLSNELGINTSVTFIAQVPDISLYLQQVADIHLLASSEEGFGLSVVEAAACGLPNIVAAAGALTEVVQNGIDGIHVQGAQPEAFAEALLRLSENADLRLQMGHAGRQHAVTTFSVAAYKNNIVQQIQRLLTSN